MNLEQLIKIAELMNDNKSTTTATVEESINKGRYIVLGNRGNTVVGDLTIKGGTGYLKNASVIRRWGTTGGLGELALSGKTESTKLDSCGEFEFEVITTCGMIPVKSDL